MVIPPQEKKKEIGNPNPLSDWSDEAVPEPVHVETKRRSRKSDSKIGFASIQHSAALGVRGLEPSRPG